LPGVARYDEFTGAYLGPIVAFPESFNGMTIGNDGTLYATNNTLGMGSIIKADPYKANPYNPAANPDYVIGLAEVYTGPSGIVMGADNHLYASSSKWPADSQTAQTAILKVNPNDSQSLQMFIPEGSGGLNAPSELLFGPDGNLYVQDFNEDSTVTILRYNGTTGAFLDNFITFSPGNQYDGILFGPDGDFYATSYDTNEVLRYDGSTGAFIGAFVAANSGGLDGPTDIAFGRDGHLYVMSYDTQKVLRFDGATGEFLNTFLTLNPTLVQSATAITFTTLVPEPQSFAAMVALVGLFGRRPPAGRASRTGRANPRSGR